MFRAYTYFIIFSLLIVACTNTAGHRYIKIKPPPFGVQFVPDQLNTILMDSGFNRISFSARVTDYHAGPTDALNLKTGEVLESSRKLQMRYQHQTYPELLVNVTVGRDKGNVKLEFYEIGRKELSVEGIGIYNQFKENLTTNLYDASDFTES